MHDILCFSRTRRSNSCCSSFGKGTGPTRWNGASEAMILDTWSKRTGMTPCRDKRVRIVIMSMWQRTKNYRLAQGGEWHLHFVVWLNESARITAHAERQKRDAERVDGLDGMPCVRERIESSRGMLVCAGRASAGRKRDERRRRCSVMIRVRGHGTFS